MIDFNQDLDFIIADFKKHYNLNYLEVINLHFKLFCVYLNALPESAMLSRIIQLRTTSELDIKDDNILKLKKQYSLEQKEANTDILSIWANELIKE
ncbi:Gp15 family bacteriophage protein [Mycoplasma sp. B6400]|uniref:Gp15 family bacteriophage protein n=1 Tax=Mycoplasma sp. B6400 TaxID=3401674 RepID=UPI003AAAA12E